MKKRRKSKTPKEIKREYLGCIMYIPIFICLMALITALVSGCILLLLHFNGGYPIWLNSFINYFKDSTPTIWLYFVISTIASLTATFISFKIIWRKKSKRNKRR